MACKALRIHALSGAVLAASSLLFTSLLTGCASSSKASPTNGGDPQLDRLNEELAASRKQNEELKTRLEAMDDKFNALNERVTTTQNALEQVAAARGVTKPTQGQAAIPQHPAEGKGAAPAPLTEKITDPALLRFRKAMILFDAGKNPEAVLAFTQFLREEADHALAPAAQFHIAESYFREKEFKLALEEYKRILVSYDRSSYVPDTLVRLIELGDKQGLEKDKAAERRQSLLRMYPQSPSALALNTPESIGVKPKIAIAAPSATSAPVAAAAVSSSPVTHAPTTSTPPASASGLDAPPEEPTVPMTAPAPKGTP